MKTYNYYLNELQLLSKSKHVSCPLFLDRHKKEGKALKPEISRVLGLRYALLSLRYEKWNYRFLIYSALGNDCVTS